MKKRLTAMVLSCLIAVSAIISFAATSGKYDQIFFNTTSIVLSPGETYSLSVSSSPSGVRAADLYWSSDDTRVVTVSASGVITAANLMGGAIVTAATDDGIKAVCYVGVGAPYGYNYGYYSGYYPGDYYYPYYNYNYNNNYPSYSYYDYTYYDYPYYPYYSPYYNDYYTNGYYSDYAYPYGYSVYVNRNRQVVYSVNKPNPKSYVRPGTASSASQMALEVQQGVGVSYNGDSIGFAYVDNANALVVTPERTGNKANALTLNGNLLNRFHRFGFKTLKYRIPDVEVAIYPDFKASGAVSLSVEKVAANTLDNVVSGPWKISANSDKRQLTYRFILESKQTKDGMNLMKLSSDGKYEKVKSDLWKMMKSSIGDAYTYYVQTEKLAPGTYALVSVK